MVLFSRLFWIFEKGKAHKDLQQAYSQLNELAELLNKNISILRQIQKELVLKRLGRTKYVSTPTGAIGFEKTLFIEESFVKKLKELASTTETRFAEALKKSSKVRPVPRIEREEILRTIAFLEDVKKSVPHLENIKKLSEKEQFQATENTLREITRLAKKYHEEEMRLHAIIKFGEENISDFLREIYLNPQHHPQEPSLLLYTISRQQLEELQEETKKINECNDPDYHIEWRRWWRDAQKPEKDKTTPLKDPHINATIKLFGGPKKDIHLLLAA